MKPVINLSGQLCFIIIFLLSWNSLSAANYFISTEGNDSNPGTFDSPFASLKQAQSLVRPGDTVFIRSRYI